MLTTSGACLRPLFQDPLTQIPGFGKLLFGLSMIDHDQRAYFEAVEARITELTLAGKYVEAFRLFDALMMSDQYPHPSTYNSQTQTHTECMQALRLLAGCKRSSLSLLMLAAPSAVLAGVV